MNASIDSKEDSTGDARSRANILRCPGHVRALARQRARFTLTSGRAIEHTLAAGLVAARRDASVVDSVVHDPVVRMILDELYRLPERAAESIAAYYERLAEQGRTVAVGDDGIVRPATDAELGIADRVGPWRAAALSARGHPNRVGKGSCEAFEQSVVGGGVVWIELCERDRHHAGS
jgi:hypothetical protein